jgi:hypothetical protein
MSELDRTVNYTHPPDETSVFDGKGHTQDTHTRRNVLTAPVCVGISAEICRSLPPTAHFRFFSPLRLYRLDIISYFSPYLRFRLISIEHKNRDAISAAQLKENKAMNSKHRNKAPRRIQHDLGNNIIYLIGLLIKNY